MSWITKSDKAHEPAKTVMQAWQHKPEHEHESVMKGSGGSVVNGAFTWCRDKFKRTFP